MAIAEPSSSAARVVLLDDHPVVGESLEMLLRVRGVEVVGRATGLEALRPLIARQEPHVAIVDVVLQGANGVPSPDEGIAAIQGELGVSPDFPPEVEEAAARAAASPRLPDLDRTDLELVTIDPDGARDLDQALHLERTGSGYRDYAPGTVERIRLTRELQAIGCTLNEAVDALAAHDAGGATCESERWRLQAVLDRVDAKVAELTALRARIVVAQEACRSGNCTLTTRAIR